VDHIAREKERARALRKSRWWQTLITKASCYYCSRKLEPREVTMDHIVPLAQGGRSMEGNVVPACKSCNTLKQDLTAAEWALRLEAARREPAG
jgi:5-methylcytosine-specific restriction endonuclease McrA